MKSLPFALVAPRLIALFVLALFGASRLVAQGAAVVLDTFGPGSVGAVVPGSSWEGQAAREGDALVVAGTARDDNGWQSRGLTLDASGMTALAVTGYRAAGNAAGTLVIELQDAALNTAIFSAPLSAFGTTSTTVRIPLQGWAAGFDFTRVTGWSIGGGVPPPGNDVFRMVLEHLELSAVGGPAVATLPLITVAPLAQSAPLDAEVRFSVAASGHPVPTFQWRREGRPIPGATGAVLTVTVTAETVGQYSVAVQNSVGSVLSAPVSLSVGAGSTGGVIAGTGSTTGPVAGIGGGSALTAGGSTTGPVAGAGGGAGLTAGGSTIGPVAGAGGGSALNVGGATAGPGDGSTVAGPGSGSTGPLSWGGTMGSGSSGALTAVGGSTAGSAGAGAGGSTPGSGSANGTGPTSPAGGLASGTGIENPSGGVASVAGAYFGTLPDGGVWALNVRSDRRGMFLAHFPATGTAAIAEVTLGADNRFQVTGTTVAPRGVVAATPGSPATASAPVSYTLRAQVSADSATG